MVCLVLHFNSPFGGDSPGVSQYHNLNYILHLSIITIPTINIMTIDHHQHEYHDHHHTLDSAGPSNPIFED